jgi:hypothetical protein
VQSSIDALKALLQHGAEQIPGPCRLSRASLRPTSEHQPPAGRDRTLRRPLVAASALDGSRLDRRKIPGAQRLGRLNTPARGRLRPLPEYPRPERGYAEAYRNGERISTAQWSRAGAQQLLHVKTAIINGRLDRYTGHHSVPALAGFRQRFKVALHVKDQGNRDGVIDLTG